MNLTRNRFTLIVDEIFCRGIACFLRLIRIIDDWYHCGIQDLLIRTEEGNRVSARHPLIAVTCDDGFRGSACDEHRTMR